MVLLCVADAVEVAVLNAGTLRRHEILAGDDEISDAMTSSLVCTDGSDLEEGLSDQVSESGAGTGATDKTESRAPHNGADSESRTPQNGAQSESTRTQPSVSSDRETVDNLGKAEHKSRDTVSDSAQVFAQTFQPIDAVVEIQNEPKVDETRARLLLEKAESMRSSDSDSDAGGAGGAAAQDPAQVTFAHRARIAITLVSLHVSWSVGFPPPQGSSSAAQDLAQVITTSQTRFFRGRFLPAHCCKGRLLSLSGCALNQLPSDVMQCVKIGFELPVHSQGTRHYCTALLLTAHGHSLYCVPRKCPE